MSVYLTLPENVASISKYQISTQISINLPVNNQYLKDSMPNSAIMR